MPLRDRTASRLVSVVIRQLRTYSAPADGAIPASKQKYVPTSGTYPLSFRAGTAHAGVKASNTSRDDVALVVSDTPCAAAAVFTRNMFKAAPVVVSKTALALRNHDGFRGVVVNSGCANAVTGTLGKEHALQMARAADQCFESEVSSSFDEVQPRTLVMSTGVIGQKLPMDRIEPAIPRAHAALGSSHEHWMRAAQAICTTDTFPKLLSRTFTLPSHPDTTYRIAGMTKGAGMIHPNLGTLLAIICTDVKIAPDSIQQLLKGATDRSFNCISIDGDTSTNDTVALYANGAAAPASATPLSLPEGSEKRGTKHLSPDVLAFRDVLSSFMTELAQLVVRDGEGATKFITVRVQSDVSYFTARRAAVSIATSSLVKTALYGKDANWGRILCAVGYAPGIIYDPVIGRPRDIQNLMDRTSNPGSPPQKVTQVQPTRTSVSFVPADGSEELRLLVRGEPQEVDEERARQILEMEDLEILVRLDDGEERAGPTWPPPRRYEAVYWTCDFSHEYVTINGDYRT